MNRPQAAWPDHEAAARAGAELYLNYLKSLRATETTTSFRTSLAYLIKSIAAGLEHGTQLVPAQVPFSTASLDPLAAGDLRALVNQWGLGVGNPLASVIVMGSEHAFDVESKEWLAGLALESCASQLLWMTDDRGQLASHIASDAAFLPKDGKSGYQSRPWQYYSVGSGHTWRMVARAVDVEFEQLSDATYQIERSAAAARRARGGTPPTPARLQFLGDLLGLFRRTARLLILHGRTPEEDMVWSVANRRLAARFLGMSPDDLDWETHRLGVVKALACQHGEKTVVCLPALNGRTSGIWKALPDIRLLLKAALDGGWTPDPTDSNPTRKPREDRFTSKAGEMKLIE